jgi:hypothetical protein
MRKMLFLSLVVVCFFISSCATQIPIGFLFTDLKLPVTATGEGGKNLKVGTAECTSILGLVATGDASIEAAKNNGGITKISHVDWEARNILGIVGTYQVIVYGQ